MAERGVIIINTGNGKGKSTAAFGQALRVAGHNLPVCIIQFIKGQWLTGEAQAVKRLGDNIELHVCGTGFTWQAADRTEVVAAAQAGWRLAQEKINSGRYRLVVLDELTYPINYGMLSEQEVVATLLARPPGLDIVITGREAGAALVAAADLVSEMREIKHPYQQGVAARLGVE
ncbi:MAG: cob(I)yrinic acid a,c-diamide adenosyltransferase, partial [Desulfobulbaceae bacterium]|nr:cob(I)yrinic acid a,c-diamide adenosyltransferase [Desulfobulbaceae bacterium]